MKTYKDLILETAEVFIDNFREEIENEIKEGSDFNSMIDHIDLHDKLHEDLDNSWYSFLRDDIFKDFDSELTTCARILDWTSNKETDSGLWEGQEPEQAIQTQAFFSVRSDVYFVLEDLYNDLAEEINNKGE